MTDEYPLSLELSKGRGPGRHGGPTPLNEKQEKYAYFRALGKTQKEAATLAGYSGSGANASRLDSIQTVKERIAELKKTNADKNLVRIATQQAELESLIKNEKLDLTYFVKELRHNLELARTSADVKGANDCLKLMMELLGFVNKGKGKGDGPTDEKPPIKISILNQLAQRNDREGRDLPANGGALITDRSQEALSSLSNDDAELEPDFSLLDGEGDED